MGLKHPGFARAAIIKGNRPAAVALASWDPLDGRFHAPGGDKAQGLSAGQLALFGPTRPKRRRRRG